MEHLLRTDQYSQWKIRLTYFLKPFTIDVFVSDCSHTLSLEIAVTYSDFVNADLVFLSLACNNCPHFCFKTLKTDTSSDWRRSIVCGGNFKIITFHSGAHCRVGKPHVKGVHHISLTFLQALHRMNWNVSFFPIPQTIYKKCLTSSTLSHLHISMDKTYDQVLLRGCHVVWICFPWKIISGGNVSPLPETAAKMVVLLLSDPVIICSVGCLFKDATLHFFWLMRNPWFVHIPN